MFLNPESLEEHYHVCLAQNLKCQSLCILEMEWQYFKQWMEVLTIFFGSLAASYMKSLIGAFKFAITVCDVFDRYDISESVKGEEREIRAAGFAYKEYEVLAG